MKSVIELNNMRFFAYHGVLPQETVVGNQFEVSMRIEADLSAACRSDDVRQTLNYAQIYDVVKAEMGIPSNLIENAAFRILQRVKEVFPEIATAEVRLRKMNPPVAGDMESAEIVLSI